MSKLTFWCDEETSEASPSDSPYFLVYAGTNAGGGSSLVRRVRKQSWDDRVDAGEPPRSTLFDLSDLAGDPDLVFVALIEEDYDPDSDLAGKVQSWMDNLDNLLQGGITHPSEVTTMFKEEFIKAIKHHSANDDLVAVKRHTSNTDVMHFNGEGGRYRVRLEL